MASAFEYVVSTLNVVQEADEDRDTYLQRVAVEIQKLSEDDWNDMPVPLQEWYNETADMLAESPEELELKDIPGTKKAVKKPAKKAAVKEAAVDGEAEAEEAPVKAKKEKAPKEPKEPKVKKEKAPKEPRGPIAANAVREILCEDMTTSLDDLMTKLEERGIAMQRSSAQVVHLNTVRAFEVAIEVGQVKKGADAVLTASA